MKKQDIVTLINQGWKVGYQKRVLGQIEDGFAIKGNQGKGINAKWIQSLLNEGQIIVDMEKSIIKQQQIIDPNATGFAGIPFTEEQKIEIIEDNKRAEARGFYGRICFKAVAK